MKLNTLFLYFYLCFLLLFAIVSASFWLDFRNNTPIPKFLITLLLDLFGVCVCFFNINIFGVNRSIVLALIWILLTPFTLYIAHTSFLLSDIVSVVLWPFVFITSYILVRSNNSNFYKLQTTFVWIMGVMLLFFLYSKHSKTIYDLEQSNMIFFPLLTLPWLMSLKRNVIKILFLLLLFIMILYSLKRSAIIVGFLCFAPYIFSFLSRYRNKFLGVLLSFSLVLALGVSFYAINQASGNIITERFSTMGEDEGSGRLIIYGLVFDMQSHSSDMEWIFGHGHYAVRQDSIWDMSAHNDFLEVLYDYGIIVLILYIFFIVNIIRQLFVLRKRNSWLYGAYFASLILFFVQSMVSHLILYASNFIFLVAFWGAVQAIIDTENNRMRYENLDNNARCSYGK